MGNSYVQTIIFASNVVTRWGELINPKHDSEPAYHLKNNLNHTFNWFTMCSITIGDLEAIYTEWPSQA